MSTIRKVVFSLLAMLIALMLFTGAAYADATKTGIITGDVVNLRSNPNISAKVIKQLKKGTSVSVTGSEGNWYKISYSDSTGWINDNYITIRDQSISSGVVSGSVVNVRSKPNLSSEVLTKLNKGTKVDIYERSGDWYRISISSDRYGWVNKEYLSIRTTTVSRGATTAAPVQTAASADQKATEGTDGGAAASESDIGDKRQEIVAYAKTLLGIKYVYGGSTTKGFDCSGFVSYVFKHFGITLERSSSDMASGGTAVKRADLQPGDLVFFDSNGGLNAINHVGIYIGNDKFIHASTSINRKVTISSLSDNFYSTHYMRARDYLTK